MAQESLTAQIARERKEQYELKKAQLAGKPRPAISTQEKLTGFKPQLTGSPYEPVPSHEPEEPESIAAQRKASINLMPRKGSMANPDGSRSSERSITVNVEELNQGRATNIPTIFDGKQRTEEEAIRRIIKSGGVDPETGRRLPGFNSVEEAVRAAGSRSNALGRLREERATKKRISSVAESRKAIAEGRAMPYRPRRFNAQDPESVQEHSVIAKDFEVSGYPKGFSEPKGETFREKLDSILPEEVVRRRNEKRAVQRPWQEDLSEELDALYTDMEEKYPGQVTFAPGQSPTERRGQKWRDDLFGSKKEATKRQREIEISKIRHVTSSIALGLIDMMASIPEYVAIASKELEDALGLFERDDEIEDRALYQLGQAMRKYSRELFPQDEDLADSFLLTVLPQGAGSLAAFYGFGAIGAVARLPLFLMPLMAGAATSSASMYLEAKNHGATDDEAFGAWLGGHLSGAMEAVPIGRALQRYDKMSGGGIKKILANGFRGGLEEMIQEVSQTVTENMVAKMTFDERRDWNAGIYEAGGAGGILGLVANMGLAAAGMSTRRKLPGDVGTEKESQYFRDEDAVRDWLADPKVPQKEKDKLQKDMDEGLKQIYGRTEEEKAANITVEKKKEVEGGKLKAEVEELTGRKMPETKDPTEGDKVDVVDGVEEKPAAEKKVSEAQATKEIKKHIAEQQEPDLPRLRQAGAGLLPDEDLRAPQEGLTAEEIPDIAQPTEAAPPTEEGAPPVQPSEDPETAMLDMRAEEIMSKPGVRRVMQGKAIASKRIRKLLGGLATDIEEKLNRTQVQDPELQGILEVINEKLEQSSVLPTSEDPYEVLRARAEDAIAESDTLPPEEGLGKLKAIRDELKTRVEEQGGRDPEQVEIYNQVLAKVAEKETTSPQETEKERSERVARELGEETRAITEKEKAERAAQVKENQKEIVTRRRHILMPDGTVREVRRVQWKKILEKGVAGKNIEQVLDANSVEVKKYKDNPPEGYKSIESWKKEDFQTALEVLNQESKDAGIYTEDVFLLTERPESDRARHVEVYAYYDIDTVEYWIAMSGGLGMEKTAKGQVTEEWRRLLLQGGPQDEIYFDPIYDKDASPEAISEVEERLVSDLILSPSDDLESILQGRTRVKRGEGPRGYPTLEARDRMEFEGGREQAEKEAVEAREAKAEADELSEGRVAAEEAGVDVELFEEASDTYLQSIDMTAEEAVESLRKIEERLTEAIDSGQDQMKGPRDSVREMIREREGETVEGATGGTIGGFYPKRPTQRTIAGAEEFQSESRLNDDRAKLKTIQNVKPSATALGERAMRELGAREKELTESIREQEKELGRKEGKGQKDMAFEEEAAPSKEKTKLEKLEDKIARGTQHERAKAQRAHARLQNMAKGRISKAFRAGKEPNSNDMRLVHGSEWKSKEEWAEYKRKKLSEEEGQKDFFGEKPSEIEEAEGAGGSPGQYVPRSAVTPPATPPMPPPGAPKTEAAPPPPPPPGPPVDNRDPYDKAFEAQIGPEDVESNETEDEKITIDKRVRRMLTTLQTAVTSQYTPLREAQKELYMRISEKMPTLDAARKAELMAGADGLAWADFLDYRQEVIDQIGKEDYRAFNAYLFLRRTKQRLEDEPIKKKVGIWTVEEAQKGLDTQLERLGDEKIAHFESVAAKYQEHTDRLLKSLVKSGILAVDQYNTIKEHNDFYALFKVAKHYKEWDAKLENSGGRITNDFAMIHSITGLEEGDVQIVDIVGETAKAIYNTRIRAEKNLFKKYLWDMADMDHDNKFFQRGRVDEYYPIEIKPIMEVLDQFRLQHMANNWQPIEAQMIKVGKMIEIAESMGIKVDRGRLRSNLGSAEIGGAEMTESELKIRAFVSEVAAHEMSHMVDITRKDQFGQPIVVTRKVFGVERKILQRLSSLINTKKDFKNELKDLVDFTGLGGSTAYRHSAKERWAEFLNLYIHNPAKTKELAPKWTLYFETELLPVKEVTKLVEGLSGFYQEIDKLPNIMSDLGKYDKGGPGGSYLERALIAAFPDKASHLGVNFGTKVPEGFKRVLLRVEGKQKALDVRADIYESIEGLTSYQGAVVTNFFAKAGALLRGGATVYNATFMVKNAFFRDPVRLALLSKHGLNLTKMTKENLHEVIRFPLDWVDALVSAMKGNFGTPDQLYMKWLRSGAGFTDLASMLMPQSLTLEEKSSKNLIEKLGNPISRFASALEQSTKLLGFKRALRMEKFESLPPDQQKAKMDEIASEIRRYSGSPDFWRHGLKVKGNWSMIFMFLNARIQGVSADLTRLGGKEGYTKEAWGNLAIGVGIPTLALAAMNYLDDEDREYFEKQNEVERHNYYMIPRGIYYLDDNGEKRQEYWTIPKDDTAKIFSAMVENFVKFALDEDPVVAREFLTDFVQDISPITMSGDKPSEVMESMFSSLNPILKTPAEFAFGRNTYYHTDIIPQKMEDWNPEDQKRSTTPGVFVGAGKVLGVSPLVLEHLTRNITASGITQFLPRKAQPGREGWTAWPVLKMFSSSPYGGLDERLERLMAVREGAGEEKGSRYWEVEAKWTELKDLDRAGYSKRLREISAEGDRELVKKIRERKKKADIGWNYIDGMTQSLGVNNGARARFIFQELKAIRTKEERDVYLRDLRKKKILTTAVRRQLNRLRRAEGENE